MEKDSIQRYVESLERRLNSNYQYAKKRFEEFREKCMIVTPGRSVSQTIIIEIREIYKEIRERLIEIKAIQNLLQGKYRYYYRKNPLRDKEILEIEILAKNYYSKFESNLKQILERKRSMVRKEELKKEEKERKGINCGAKS